MLILIVIVVSRAPEKTDFFTFINRLDIRQSFNELNQSERTPSLNSSMGTSILVLQETESKLKARLSRLQESLERNKPDLRTGKVGDPDLASQLYAKISNTRQEIDALKYSFFC